MTAISYPDDESVAEITMHFLPALPADSLPVLLGFRFDGETIHSECAEVYLSGDRGPREPNPIHAAAARIRTVLGDGMFGFGFVFPVFADQLDSRADNSHIPAPVHTAAARLAAPSDLIAAATIDAAGRQWWAVLPRHLPGFAPILLRFPAVAPQDWRLPESLHASLWTAALALDVTNHPHLLRLRTPHPAERQRAR
ncbi:hypothetical protein [Nocardia sp. NPDC024068]|uniref:hypothetical protein n=1 Tax=Nocardia sp. NPDC024068 TaxID=3157197 RepID=UPI0033CFAAAE